MRDSSEQADAKRIVDALQARGVSVNSVYDLVNSKSAYPRAIPVLVMHLPEVTDLSVKEGIIRALTVKEARGIAGPALIREFGKLPYEDSKSDRIQALKWAIANALSVAAAPSDFENIAGLLREKRHGKAREMLAIALARTQDPRAPRILQEMLDDEGVTGHAITALGRLGATEARPKIERFLQDDRAWVRQEAKKTLERLDRTPAGRSTRG